MVIDRQQPRNQGDEVDELLALVLSGCREVDLVEGLEALLLAERALVVEQLEHVEDSLHQDVRVPEVFVHFVRVE